MNILSLLFEMSHEQAARIFGMTKKPTDAELKAKYRELSLKNHPDRGGDSEKMRLVNQAYSILTGKERPTAETKSDTNASPGPMSEEEKQRGISALKKWEAAAILLEQRYSRLVTICKQLMVRQKIDANEPAEIIKAIVEKLEITTQAIKDNRVYKYQGSQIISAEYVRVAKTIIKSVDQTDRDLNDMYGRPGVASADLLSKLKPINEGMKLINRLLGEFLDTAKSKNMRIFPKINDQS